MGLALGGGIGLSMRAHGLVCDSILGVQLVLANGSVVTSSALSRSALLISLDCLLWETLADSLGGVPSASRFESQIKSKSPYVCPVECHGRVASGSYLARLRALASCADLVDDTAATANQQVNLILCSVRL